MMTAAHTTHRLTTAVLTLNGKRVLNLECLLFHRVRGSTASLHSHQVAFTLVSWADDFTGVPLRTEQLAALLSESIQSDAI